MNNIHRLHAEAMVELGDLSRGHQNSTTASIALARLKAEAEARVAVPAIIVDLLSAQEMITAIRAVKDAESARYARLVVAGRMARYLAAWRKWETDHLDDAIRAI